MKYIFTTTPETAHKLTALKKKTGYYFRTLMSTENTDKVECEVTEPMYNYIKENNIEVSFYTYDVEFNDENDSNSKGWQESYEYCKNYIDTNNGTNESYFADYKGGVVSIVCNETEETVYQEIVK